jgi:diaminopimelate decarboxylase
MTHPTVAGFAVREGMLVIGGVPVDRLAHQIGRTPFFAYDRAALDARITQLRTTLPGAISLSYAVKANPMPAVVQHLSTLVDHLDVASAGELRTALDTPMPAERVSFAGPGKSEADLTRAVASGVVVEAESTLEISRIIAIGDRLGLRPRVAIRVNPDFEVKGSGMRMGGGPQQFGIDAEKVPAVLRDLVAADVDFLGFHVFAGSQNLRADIIAEAQNRTVELVLRLAGEYPGPLRYVNLGGGFGVPYFEKDQPLDLPLIGENLAKLLETSIRPAAPDARVVIELGRYIVAESGVYVSRVVDRKESRGRTFLVLDGGLHHQLAASGNFGQVIRRNYPVVVANRMAQAATETVNVVGCLCTPLDVLGDKVSLPSAEVGDLVAVFHAGAYGLTASPTAFLGHEPPLEALV